MNSAPVIHPSSGDIHVGVRYFNPVTVITAVVQTYLYSKLMGSSVAGYLKEVEGEWAMSDHQGVYFHGNNPAIPEKLRRANCFIIRGLVLGLMLGIMIRAGWDFGIIPTLSLTLREVSAALWTMVKDSAAAWGDFFQFVIESVDS